MENLPSLDRLLFAILRKDDYEETVAQLNSRGFFVTKISTSGGFLKKENVTLMLGVESARMEEAIEILKAFAGRRRSQTYVMPAPDGSIYTGNAFPLEVDTGGVTIFTMKLENFQKL